MALKVLEPGFRAVISEKVDDRELARAQDQSSLRHGQGNLHNTPAMEMQIRHEVEDGGESPEWDAFVVDCQDAHHEQTSLWGEMQRLRGWRPTRVIFRRGGSVAGGAQILERSIGRWAKVGLIDRGPLLTPDNESLRQTIVETLQQHARMRGLTYLALNLPYSGEAWIAALEKARFSLRPPILPPSTSMRSTVVVDLRQDLDTMLRKMRSSTRRNIRRGEKQGFSLCAGGENDLGRFAELMTQLCQRRGVEPNIPLGRFLQELWRAFAPRGYLRLFILEKNHEPVCGELVFTIGSWVRSWRIGWSGRYKESYPNEVLRWEVIKWSKVNRFECYDLFGFDTANAKALAEGRPIAEKEWCGMSFFKLGFGGRVMPLSPAYCLFLHPVIRYALMAGGTMLLDSKVFRKTVNRVWSRSSPRGA